MSDIEQRLSDSWLAHVWTHHAVPATLHLGYEDELELLTYGTDDRNPSWRGAAIQVAEVPSLIVFA